MNIDWRPIQKVIAAIIVAAIGDGAFLIGALSGTLSWREAGIGMLAASLPVLVAYLKRDEIVDAGRDGK